MLLSPWANQKNTIGHWCKTIQFSVWSYSIYSSMVVEPHQNILCTSPLEPKGSKASATPPYHVPLPLPKQFQRTTSMAPGQPLQSSTTTSQLPPRRPAQHTQVEVRDWGGLHFLKAQLYQAPSLLQLPCAGRAQGTGRAWFLKKRKVEERDRINRKARKSIENGRNKVKTPKENMKHKPKTSKNYQQLMTRNLWTRSLSIYLSIMVRSITEGM